MSGFGRTWNGNVIKPCRAHSCRYPVNGIAVRPERHGNVADHNRRHPLATRHYGPSPEANRKATEAAAGGKATTEADAGGRQSCIPPDIADHSVYGCARIDNGENSQA